MFVDSHCHLAFPELRARVPELLAQMSAAQVSAALCICTTMEEFGAVHELATAHPQLWASAGVHPDTEGLAEPTQLQLESLALLPKVVAIGETGLDYYRLNGRSLNDMGWQRQRFRLHIRAARATRRPLVVHTRAASADTISILKDEHAHEAGGVFHCFTETLDVARAALDLGFYISFSGIVTFRNAADLRDVARFVPLDRCLIETDSPYLAPVPHRGKTNQPAWVPFVAQCLADTKGVSAEAIGAVTTENFHRLFALTMSIHA